MNNTNYIMLLISSNEDIILITEKSCLTCLQTKKNLTILKNLGLMDFNEVKLFIKNYNLNNPLNVICECKILH